MKMPDMSNNEMGGQVKKGSWTVMKRSGQKSCEIYSGDNKLLFYVLKVLFLQKIIQSINCYAAIVPNGPKGIFFMSRQGQ